MILYDVRDETLTGSPNPRRPQEFHPWAHFTTHHPTVLYPLLKEAFMHTRLIPLFCFFFALTSGCVGTMHAKTSVAAHKPEYRLIVKAPMSILGGLDPSAYTFVIVAKS